MRPHPVQVGGRLVEAETHGLMMGFMAAVLPTGLLSHQQVSTMLATRLERLAFVPTPDTDGPPVWQLNPFGKTVLGELIAIARSPDPVPARRARIEVTVAWAEQTAWPDQRES